jgi:magnesium-transporting ATPase (P-type)
MITGDNATAARQVAKEVGILDDDANSEYAVLEGH